MFNSTILDVAVGLIFTFLAVSLVASAVTEAMASGLGWRAKTLLSGVKALLNDAEFKGLAKDIYNHALVNPQGSGNAAAQTDVTDGPSYVDPTHFANALIDLVGVAGGANPGAMNAAVAANVKDPQLQKLLTGVIDRSQGNLDKIRGELATWFDSSMDRVSGAYKRKTQLVSFIVALLAALFLNVDSIQVAKTLWQQPMVTKAIDSNISVNTDRAVANALAQLNTLDLPIGWPGDTFAKFIANPSFLWIEALVGWLITAFATLFGAPFWFDALQQFVRLKGSGPSPAEKKDNSGAAA